MKRCFDIVVAAVALVLLSPVVAVVAVVVWVGLGAPIILRQVRPGRHGVPFVIYKFRTMTEATDADGNLLPDADRLTRVGRFLRATSLDELPELVNVLKGEMSLVGPRPLRMTYLPLYTPEQARRHEVLPGITGWAQINGRNSTTWEKRFELDVWYVDHASLRLDLLILLKTALSVVMCRDVSAAGHVTMPAFTGSGASHPDAGPSGQDDAGRP